MYVAQEAECSHCAQSDQWTSFDSSSMTGDCGCGNSGVTPYWNTKTKDSLELLPPLNVGSGHPPVVNIINIGNTSLKDGTYTDEQILDILTNRRAQ